MADIFRNKVFNRINKTLRNKRESDWINITAVNDDGSVDAQIPGNDNVFSGVPVVGGGKLTSGDKREIRFMSGKRNMPYVLSPSGLLDVGGEEEVTYTEWLCPPNSWDGNRWLNKTIDAPSGTVNQIVLKDWNEDDQEWQVITDISAIYNILYQGPYFYISMTRNTKKVVVAFESATDPEGYEEFHESFYVLPNFYTDDSTKDLTIEAFENSIYISEGQYMYFLTSQSIVVGSTTTTIKYLLKINLATNTLAAKFELFQNQTSPITYPIISYTALPYYFVVMGNYVIIGYRKYWIKGATGGNPDYPVHLSYVAMIHTHETSEVLEVNEYGGFDMELVQEYQLFPNDDIHMTNSNGYPDNNTSINKAWEMTNYNINIMCDGNYLVIIPRALRFLQRYYLTGLNNTLVYHTTWPTGYENYPGQRDVLSYGWLSHRHVQEKPASCSVATHVSQFAINTSVDLVLTNTQGSCGMTWSYGYWNPYFMSGVGSDDLVSYLGSYMIFLYNNDGTLEERWKSSVTTEALWEKGVLYDGATMKADYNIYVPSVVNCYCPITMKSNKLYTYKTTFNLSSVIGNIAGIKTESNTGTATAKWHRISSMSSRVECIDLSNGTVLWHYDFDGEDERWGRITQATDYNFVYDYNFCEGVDKDTDPTTWYPTEPCYSGASSASGNDWGYDFYVPNNRFNREKSTQWLNQGFVTDDGVLVVCPSSSYMKAIAKASGGGTRESSGNIYNCAYPTNWWLGEICQDVGSWLWQSYVARDTRHYPLAYVGSNENGDFLWGIDKYYFFNVESGSLLAKTTGEMYFDETVSLESRPFQFVGIGDYIFHLRAPLATSGYSSYQFTTYKISTQSVIGHINFGKDEDGNPTGREFHSKDDNYKMMAAEGKAYLIAYYGGFQTIYVVR